MMHETETNLFGMKGSCRETRFWESKRAFHFYFRCISTSYIRHFHSKTSFEKNCFSARASTLNMGLINNVDMVCLSPVGYGV